MRVLLVDDDADIRTIAELALTTVGGWQVESVHTGALALERARATRPELILLDVMMPGMDGPEVLRQLRADAELREIPVVFMTARVQPREIREYMALGANGVVDKPFDPLTLCERISAILADSPRG